MIIILSYIFYKLHIILEVKKMSYLIMAGIDYENSNVETREKVSFTPSAIKRAYEKIKSEGKIKEAVIVSTCNRSEIYGISEKINGEEYLKNFYSSFFNICSQEAEKNIVLRTGFQTIYHLFQVTNGFKSMVLGEDQILGQVKDAYKQALINKGSGKILNRLFLNSITDAKKIKTQTSLTNTSVSVSAIGIKLIHSQFKSLKGKKALVVGLGKMSMLSIQYLLAEGISKIYVTNRTRTKVLDIENTADNIEGLDFKCKQEAFKDVDIIVSCTSAPHFVIHKDEFVNNYNDNPICILDLALPRDVEPEIGTLDNVNLYVIDDIKSIADKNAKKKIVEYEKGMEYLKEDVIKYINWLSSEGIELNDCNNITKSVFHEGISV